MSANTKWLFIGSFLASTLTAYLSAFALSTFTERQLALEADDQPSAVTEKTSPKRPKKTKPKRRKSTSKELVNPIVQRSIFDSSKANIVKEESSSDGESVATDLNLTLLATIVAFPEQYSVALIKEDNSGNSMSYGVGFEILGEATITKIEKEKVYFKRKNSEQVEFIELNAEKSDTGKKPAKKNSRNNDEDSGIEKTGANQYVVDQKVLDEILENPEKLYTQVRVTPHKDSNGEIDGYRMTGIRRNSIFYKLGVKNGDIVHNVNGKPLTSMSAAMDAYNSLSNSKNFSFDITRRKSKRTFDYEVR